MDAAKKKAAKESLDNFDKVTNSLFQKYDDSPATKNDLFILSDLMSDVFRKILDCLD